MKVHFIAIGTLFLAACASEAPKITQTDASKTTIAHTNSTEELNEGKKLYEANCNSCHSLYAPSSQTVKGWQHEVPSMSKKVNRNAGTEVLDAAKQELILRYLLAMIEPK